MLHNAWRSVASESFVCSENIFLGASCRRSIDHQKIAKNTLKKFDCGRVFYDEFYLLTLGERKNDFNIEKILETCSGISNNGQDTIS